MVLGAFECSQLRSPTFSPLAYWQLVVSTGLFDQDPSTALDVDLKLVCRNLLLQTLNSGSHTNKTANKKRAWRPLKQLISLERSLPFPADAVTYWRLEAPPSFVPAKKYSDISGLPAKYTDPHTKLRYATAEEFKVIQSLPSDIVAGYLALRKAFNPVG
ncbi:INO80 complex subunit C-like [Pollicipes pollicipes]|uniref:INO80 complex subunit C-like n=1 Tax=Pollicipes pollicipes TaxID=41117 RepID=UPI001885030F|nr:INO80 complex subunit C-like [Pollicipes pollicipes]